MPSLETTGKTYWRSLNDLADSPELKEIVENEFPSMLDAVVDSVSRRRFVQIMGASLALGGMTGCDFIRWPKEKILPYAQRPEDRDPGTPVEYATTIELSGVGVGVLAKSFDGRPIKIEGNPQHPGSLGATTGWMQASLLSLYDPDRSRAVRKKGVETDSSWEAFLQEVSAHFADKRAAKGAKVCVLAEASSSPTQNRLRKELAAICPQLHWYEHEPVSRRNSVEGARMVFQAPHRTHLHLGKAEAIVSLDADLFGDHPDGIRLSREFAASRRPGAGISRLYVVESGFSVTGGMADHRLPLTAGQIEHFGLALAAELIKAPSVKATQALADALGRYDLAKAPAWAKAWPAAASGLVASMARDLLAMPSAIAVGARQPARLHALGHMLNGLLGNVGETVTYTADEAEAGGDVGELVDKIMKGDQVDTLIIMGANPVYTAPADLKFEEALQRVPLSIHLGTYNDETGTRCTWHIPRAHYLESWGDACAWDGTIGITQPLIQPFFGGKTALELLAFLLGKNPTESSQSHPYNLVRETYKGRFGASFEAGWRQALHDGVVAQSASTRVTPQRSADQLVAQIGNLAAPAAASAQAMEVVFYPDRKLYDGRFANNSWLQELPDPLTKLTWDNAALLSPETAKGLGVTEGDVVSITVPGAEALTAAVYVLPGLPEHSVNLSLGYGRGAEAGVVAQGAGFNAYQLRSRANPEFAPGAAVAKTGQRYALSTTQDHQILDVEMLNEEKERRAGELVREATSEHFAEHRKFAKDAWEGGPHGVGPDPATTELWKPPQNFSGHRWAMSIDLNVCNGCSACVVACVAENNIPMVGKSEIARGREMHWLRIDRYFSDRPMAGDGTAEGENAPLRVVHQPLPCQQCETAPCEAVCPVAATTHSDEGLNDMVYNRCIGTRYCSNNCPYKVRHYNYFYNHHGPFHPRSEPGHSQLPKPPKSVLTKKLPHAAAISKMEQMVYNPNVTVRSRGVMEKCTYCVQRIKAGTIPNRNANFAQVAKLEAQLKKAQADLPEGDSRINELERELIETRRVPDGTIQTACQQACPSQAIVFGDLNDPDSEVSKKHASDRSYGILTSLNTRPRTKYMAKLRNPAGKA